MKKIKVLVKDSSTLILKEDAKSGDIIDLNEIESIDLSYIDSKLNSELAKKIKKDLEINFDFKEKSIKSENDKLLSEVENKYKSKISELEYRLNQFETLKQLELKSQESKLELIHQDTIKSTEKNYLLKQKDLENKILELENKLLLNESTKNLEIENAKNIVTTAYLNTINELKAEINSLKLKSEIDLKDAKTLFDKELASVKIEHNNETNNLKDEIHKLTLSKSNINIKLLGEELEKWCNEEYQAYSLNGFEFCTWEKDNNAVADLDGTNPTKADYVFKAYLDDTHTQLLSSVCLEMKNEASTSKTKKKNQDHYEKLDKDRKKKECEYALLVSELEWDSTNDCPIKKVPGYDKMYMVRPQYFITFLSLINNLANKYRDIINQKQAEEINFKNSIELIQEFEQMKNTYFEKPLNSIQSKVETILQSSLDIQKANLKIQANAQDIITSTIETMRTKIERFDIKKIGKKADKLN